MPQLLPTLPATLLQLSARPGALRPVRRQAKIKDFPSAPRDDCPDGVGDVAGIKSEHRSLLGTIHIGRQISQTGSVCLW
jgi:hypothetical protein